MCYKTVLLHCPLLPKHSQRAGRLSLVARRTWAFVASVVFHRKAAPLP
jgi:hypothetical protein